MLQFRISSGLKLFQIERDNSCEIWLQTFFLIRPHLVVQRLLHSTLPHQHGGWSTQWTDTVVKIAKQFKQKYKILMEQAWNCRKYKMCKKCSYKLGYTNLPFLFFSPSHCVTPGGKKIYDVRSLGGLSFAMYHSKEGGALPIHWLVSFDGRRLRVITRVFRCL